MSTPQANPAAPTTTTTPAAVQGTSQALVAPQAVTGTAQPSVPAPPARSRAPRGPIPVAPGNVSSGISALLELTSATPMFTDQRRSPNTFVPDSNHLFHMLSICDTLMVTTHRFTQSSPGWMPLVSQLYVSLMWIYHILNVYVSSGYGLQFSNLVNQLTNTFRLDECLIPGPLVPFFESITANSGPFEWIGDIIPRLPAFKHAFDARQYCFKPTYLRMIPFPALMLDQLHHYSTLATVGTSAMNYSNFQWYRNIFQIGVTVGTMGNNMLAPNHSGTLFVTDAQFTAAKPFWFAHFNGKNRNNANTGPAFNKWENILGLIDQNGNDTSGWVQHASIIMQKYCLFFNGSKPLKFVSTTGIGAPLVSGTSDRVSSWLYPNPIPAPFSPSKFDANHALPGSLSLSFSHSDHTLEEIAEQYAILVATNVDWYTNSPLIGAYPAGNPTYLRTGTYWTMPPHRHVNAINLLAQYAHLVARRFHQSNSLRSE